MPSGHTLEIVEFDEKTVDVIRNVCNNYEGWMIDVSSQEKGTISLLNCSRCKPDEEGTPIIVDGRSFLIELNINLHP